VKFNNPRLYNRALLYSYIKLLGLVLVPHAEQYLVI